MNYQFLNSPIGSLRLVSNGSHLLRVEFHEMYDIRPDEEQREDAVLETSMTQLREYFANRRSRFDLPLDAGGTAFQRAVWRALADIPYGELRSYSDIARTIGKPTAVRAVGAANGRNPLPIIVPCHRVIGSNGSLTGFAGGLEIKTHLLAFEGAL